MKYHAACYALGLGSVLMVVGCTDENGAVKKDPPVTPAKVQIPTKKVDLGKNVALEIQGNKRRVLLQSYVCLRQGQLEQFLTRQRPKEHEAILAADVGAR